MHFLLDHCRWAVCGRGNCEKYTWEAQASAGQCPSNEQQQSANMEETHRLLVGVGVAGSRWFLPHVPYSNSGYCEPNSEGSLQFGGTLWSRENRYSGWSWCACSEDFLQSKSIDRWDALVLDLSEHLY